MVHVAKLGQGEQLAARPRVRLERLVVNPSGGVGVTAHLHVLAKLLVTDGPTLIEQPLHLGEHERVALDGGRVVGLLKPDVVPYVVRKLGRRQTAELSPQLGDLDAQALIDGRARWGGHA
jgi:hypothetical protein